MWVYDSKSITDVNKRRDLLEDKLENRLTRYNVNIFISSD